MKRTKGITFIEEEMYPSAEGEYLLTAHTPYVISFKGCKELSYELTYDISDDREVTLVPDEERIVKLGKIYDEIKTISTGNDEIKITGIYRGTPDDLNSYGLAEVIKFCDLPAGNYLLDVQSSNGSVDMDVYCDGLEYTNGMST